MDKRKAKFCSMFDEMEAKSETPLIFEWIPASSAGLVQGEYLYCGELMVSKDKNISLKKRKCVLYTNCLVQYKVQGSM